MGKVVIAAFVGKVLAAIFIAVCAALGFGPKEWAAMILGVEPGLIARSGFVLLAAITAIVLMWPYLREWRRKATSPDLSLTEAARLMYELASPKLKTDIRGMDKSGEEIESSCKTMILVAGSQGVIELYGRRGEGLVRELIPAQELDNLQPNTGDEIGTLAHTANYIDVAMRRSDVRRATRQFED